jgi:hypothetical protein
MTKDQRTFKIIFAILFVMQALDIWFTSVVISKGGMEINMFANFFVSKGLLAMIIFKACIFVPICAVVWNIYPRLVDRQKEFVLGVYTGLVIWYSFVTFWNLHQLIKTI